MLIMGDFFSHIVFKSCLFLMGQNEYLWSKGLIFNSVTLNLGSSVSSALDLRTGNIRLIPGFAVSLSEV